MRLENRLAVVTGAGQGIGRGIALTFAREGANIIVADINTKSAEAVASEVRLFGRKALAIKLDVTNSDEVNEVAAKVLATFGPVDILVNNAGIWHTAASEEETEAAWDATINVNLKGQFLCSQAFGRQMIKQKKGKIVNLASTSAHRGANNTVSYCASKAGVLGLTRALAVDWAKYNINVNSVSPAFAMTPMTVNALKERGTPVESLAKKIPLGRTTSADDMANAALFLVSSEADNITGQDIIVDGGLTTIFMQAG